MGDASIQPILDFNREIAALAAAGLYFDLAETAVSKIDDLETRLQQINTSLESRAGDGQTAEQALDSDPTIPDRYRAAIESWLKCGDRTVALDCLSATNEARQQMRENVRRSISYPTLVMMLTYGALVWLCLFTVPKLQALYEQMGQTPDAAGTFLVQCRSWLPVWGPSFPLVVIVGWFWWRKQSPLWTWRRLPGSDSYFSSIQQAELASRMAALLDSGVSSQDAVVVAQAGSLEANRLRPLLAWAVNGDLNGQPRATVMRMVAETYRRMADRQAKNWYTFASLFVGLLIAAGFVLAYGFALFLAMRNLWIDISIRGGP